MPYPMKKTKKTAWLRITETVELKSKTWALGLVIAVLSSTGFAQNKVSHLTRDWLDFSDQTLGVQLKYPRHLSLIHI